MVNLFMCKNTFLNILMNSRMHRIIINREIKESFQKSCLHSGESKRDCFKKAERV